MEIRYYVSPQGRIPFEEWLQSLKDRHAIVRIAARLRQAGAGNLGDFKSVGEGVQEMRIDHGPGYRIYASRQGPVLLILLCGSTKASQAKTIKQAHLYLEDWKEQLKEANR